MRKGEMNRQEMWEHGAACAGIGHADPDMFFDPEMTRQVRRLLCRACPVSWECFSMAKNGGLYGIWGGVFFDGRRMNATQLTMTKQSHRELLDKKSRR